MIHHFWSIVQEELEKWDRKALKGSGRDAVRDCVKRKEKQAHCFVIDITGWKGASEDVIRQAEKVFESSNTWFVDELIIVSNGEIVKGMAR